MVIDSETLSTLVQQQHEELHRNLRVLYQLMAYDLDSTLKKPVLYLASWFYSLIPCTTARGISIVHRRIIVLQDKLRNFTRQFPCPLILHLCKIIDRRSIDDHFLRRAPHPHKPILWCQQYVV